TPVGDVMLSSVSIPPITSIPTKIWPWLRRNGEIVSMISRSRAVIAVLTARLAVDQDDPLVAVDRLGQVALGERPPRARAGRGLDDRRRVGIAGAHHE